MTSQNHPVQKQSKTRWAVVCALLAVMIRVLVPAGFMIAPASANAGMIEITLCGAYGERQAWLAADGTIVEADEHNQDDGTDAGFDHDTCAFASGINTPPAASDAAMAPVFPAIIQTQVSTSIADLVPGRGLAAPPPPATAPPTLI